MELIHRRKGYLCTRLSLLANNQHEVQERFYNINEDTVLREKKNFFSENIHQRGRKAHFGRTYITEKLTRTNIEVEPKKGSWLGLQMTVKFKCNIRIKISRGSIKKKSIF